MKQPQPCLLSTVNKVHDRNTALGSTVSPSEAAEGLRHGLVYKREVSGRTWDLQEKNPTKCSFYSISDLMLSPLVTCVFPREVARLLAVVAVTAVLVEFGVSGAAGCVLCSPREKGRAHGPDNIKNQVSVMQVTPGTLREIVVPLKVQNKQSNPKSTPITSFRSVGTNSQ